jgi:hypothetical protein
MKKIFFVMLFAVLTFIAIFPRSLQIPQILNNVRAKNLCTCLFVEEVSIDRCRGQNSKNFPYFGEAVDFSNKKVSFSLAGFFKTEVSFEADFGCRLKESTFAK